MARDTNQPRHRAEAQRAAALARFAMERSHAIDPRVRATHDRVVRAAADQQIQRQNLIQQATQNGRTLTSDERASLPASAASTARDRSARSTERPGDPGETATTERAVEGILAAAVAADKKAVSRM